MSVNYTLLTYCKLYLSDTLYLKKILFFGLYVLKRHKKA